MDVDVTPKLMSEKKKDLWKGVTVLAIEEVSMVSASMFASLHTAAVAATGRRAEIPFAGLDVMALGDFRQLKPVGGESLSHAFSIDGGAAAPASSATSALGGQQLFMSMTTWVVLHQGYCTIVYIDAPGGCQLVLIAICALARLHHVASTPDSCAGYFVCLAG